MQIYHETSESLTLSLYINGVLTDADSVPNVTVTRLSDDVEIITTQTAASVSTGKYKYTLTTANTAVLGKFRAVWTYVVNAVTNIKTEYYDVVVGYANAQEARDFYAGLTGNTNDEIYQKEKLARKIIDVYCNQTFGFELDTQYKIRGDDKNTLFLNKRLYNLDEVLINGVDDVTSEVEIDEDYWLRVLEDARPGFFIDIKRGITEPSRFFRQPVKYWVTGDWGWESVPDDINLACLMLIKDYFCDDTMLRQHGIWLYSLGDKEIRTVKDFWGTTGNFDVDMLLSNYTYVAARLI